MPIDLMQIQIPMRIQIQFQNQGFDDQKLEKIYSWKFLYLFIKICNLLFHMPP